MTTTTTDFATMTTSRARRLGETACAAGQLRAPAANGEIRAWLEAARPAVGDPHTAAVFAAYSDGYQAAIDRELAAEFGFC